MFNAVKTSKFLSLVLRHQPECIDVALDEHGWVNVDTLLEKMNQHGHYLTREQLDIVVGTDSKGRYEYDEQHVHIRACQGHSVKVDLCLDSVIPPDQLFHGTVLRNMASIKEKGLLKGQRQHVHLSSDFQTAESVGARRGDPVVLTIDAKGMYDNGHKFYKSNNGVWLTEIVPPNYLTNLCLII